MFVASDRALVTLWSSVCSISCGIFRLCGRAFRIRRCHRGEHHPPRVSTKIWADPNANHEQHRPTEQRPHALAPDQVLLPVRSPDSQLAVAAHGRHHVGGQLVGALRGDVQHDALRGASFFCARNFSTSSSTPLSSRPDPVSRRRDRARTTRLQYRARSRCRPWTPPCRVVPSRDTLFA